jgi:DNA-binding transcriptional ArsR family regulator
MVSLLRGLQAGADALLGESLRERFGEHPEVPIKQQALKLLASDTRLAILKRLDERRMTVSELSRALELNKSTVHEHLGKLVEGGLVRRDASPDREWVYYDLTKTARYVLRPASARFVLMMGAAVLAGVVLLAFLQLLAVSGQSLAIASEEGPVPAGEANVWDVSVTRPGFLGLREAAPQASLYLLDAEQAARYQLTRQLPEGARLLGPDEALAQDAPGHYHFRATLAPGVHYLLARSPAGLADALLPLLSEPVRVRPHAPTVLLGIDSSKVELDVRFEGQAVPSGFVRALDAAGHEIGAAAVINGRAVLPLQRIAEDIAFEFKPQAPGSAFAAAEGELHAVEPAVAFAPAEVAVRVPTSVRVVVDDPLGGGPRAGAPITVEQGGRVVAQAQTDASGAGLLSLRAPVGGDLVVKAGALEVGRIVAKPGLRLWLEPGPYVQGQVLRVRTLQSVPALLPVGNVTLYAEGVEVGRSDERGEFRLPLPLGGPLALEARSDGYVSAFLRFDVGLAGVAPPPYDAQPGLAGASHQSAPPPEDGLRVKDASFPLGKSTRVQGLVRNDDTLPRVVRAELREDGRVIAVRGIEVPAGQEAWVNFTYEPAAPGVHVLQVNDGPTREVEVLGALPSNARATPGAPLPLALLALAGAAMAVARRRR